VVCERPSKLNQLHSNLMKETTDVAMSRVAGLAFLWRGGVRLLAHWRPPWQRNFAMRFDQLHGDGRGERKADRAFVVDLVRRQVALERRDEATGAGVERVVPLPPSQIENGETRSL